MLKKLSISFFVILSFVISQFAWAQSLQGDKSKDEATTRGEKVDLPYQTVFNYDPDAVLFDNGPVISLPAGGCAGGDASILDGALGHTLYGWGHQQNLGNYMADDFTSTASWNIDSLQFFAYQTGATTPTINGVYVQIWNGAPNAGGTIVWGDLTTNRLQSVGFYTGPAIYRAQNTTPTDCNRRLQRIVATVGGVNLPAGQYWVQWGMTGTLSSGPWCPPVTIAGQAITGDALQNVAGVWAAALNGTSPNGAPFIVHGTSGLPCPVGAPTNPSPANGAIDVPVSGNTATWTNGAGTTNVEVWFGEVGSLVQVYDGVAIQSFSLAPVEPLNYFTDYGWRIVCKDATCGTQGPTWTFTTIQDPNLNCWTDQFESGTGAWTIVVNPPGAPTCQFQIYNPPYPNTYQLPATSSGGVFAADADDCNGTTGNLNSTATITNPFDFSLYQTVYIEWDNDWQAIDATDSAFVEVSLNGSNWTAVRTFDAVDVRNTHEFVNISTIAALQPTVYVRVRSVQPGWDWFWAIDNFSICGSDPIPVELTSFVVVADYGVVELSWITSTETNNLGFEVQRSSGGEFETIAFVEGHGTTTETQVYSYKDRSVVVGLYSYRLKQVDFDGKFKYSIVVEVDVPMLKEFALDQNYPNPFNPSTKIAFRLAVDSKVSLKVFDILGQEVATLVNTNLVAGAHSIVFNASSLNSGVYLYRIEATGIDGTNFVDVKKMILTK